MTLNPPDWVAPITEACEGGASCFTTGIDPGFANDLFPMTLMGLCAEVRVVRALEILDYTNYEGDYENEMGIGRPPEYQAMLEHPEILTMAWGATVPMMAHAVGIELDEITTTWDKWVTDEEVKTAKGVINPGEVAAINFTINGVYKGETRVQLQHVNRVGTHAALFVLMTLAVFVLLSIKYAEVTVRYPEGGGVVTVGTRALHPYVGLIGGMFILVDYFLTAALTASSSFRIFRPRRSRSFTALPIGSSRNSSTRRRID